MMEPPTSSLIGTKRVSDIDVSNANGRKEGYVYADINPLSPSKKSKKMDMLPATAGATDGGGDENVNDANVDTTMTDEATTTTTNTIPTTTATMFDTSEIEEVSNQPHQQEVEGEEQQQRQKEEEEEELAMADVVDAPPPQANEAIHDVSHDTSITTSATEPSNIEEEESEEAKNNNEEGVTADDTEVQIKEDGNDEDAPFTDTTTARKGMMEETMRL